MQISAEELEKIMNRNGMKSLTGSSRPRYCKKCSVSFRSSLKGRHGRKAHGSPLLSRLGINHTMCLSESQAFHGLRLDLSQLGVM